MFPQKYQPGHQAQSDFTFMGRPDDPGPAVSPSAVPLRVGLLELGSDHAVFQSFESLSLGLQNALGALTDRLSAAVKNLKREEFTERYQALLRHFGMRSSRTQAGKAHENGDVEQSHHPSLSRKRDFSSREEYAL